MASPGSPERYRFGPFELQPDNRRLLKDGATILLRPRAFDLLAALVERAGHLVTKDELLDQVWPKMVVEEAALHVQVSALRKVLGADAITTVSGRGYQFTLPVTKGDGQADRASKPKHSLPHQLTSFIGREQEIAQLKELATTNRLVTLTGAGGAGKTRLALQVAGQLLDAFPDGVWLVELAALSDPRLVPQAVARALALTEQPARPVIETLGDYLASKKLLLVLDNVEHLLDACVRLVDEILRRCRDVAVLVTGRERLAMAGELIYRVPSLTVPGPDDNVAPDALLAYEGVRLFVDRAKLLRADFSVTADNAALLASICYRLDGIPLAIELAAPRLRSMSAEELSERLDQRFGLLTDGSRTALPRHRTLRSMIDWSYDLLTNSEQAMLSRIAVFAGGWTLTAAEQVCAGDAIETNDVINLLGSLTDKNLVAISEHHGATRYWLMETIRQYAQDRLRESSHEAECRSGHLAAFVAFAEEAYPELRGPDQRTWLDRLEAEHDNFRAALTWSVSANAEVGLRLAATLARFWAFHSHLAEARTWLTRLLDAVPSTSRTIHRVKALSMAGYMAMVQRDHAVAEAFCEQAIILARELNDLPQLAVVANNLSYVLIEQARFAEAEPLLQESIAVCRVIGDRERLANNLVNLGVVMRARGDRVAALTLFEESLALARDTGNRHLVATTLDTLNRDALLQGNLRAAEAHLRETITIFDGLGDRGGVANALEGFALLASAKDASRRAARMWGAAERLRDEVGAPIRLHDQAEHNRLASSARTACGDDAFDEAWREGREMSHEEAMNYAIGDSVGRPD